MAPTRVALQKMMSVCSNFTTEYKVVFNPSKSKIIAFGSDACLDNMSFEGGEIQHVLSDSHLGSPFGKDIPKRQVDQAIAELYSRCNLLISQFGHASSKVKYRLFNLIACQYTTVSFVIFHLRT